MVGREGSDRVSGLERRIFMTTDLEQLETMVGAQLAREKLPTPQRIRELINQLRAVLADVTNTQAEEIAQQFESMHGVTMDIGAVLQEKNFEPWLEDARGEMDLYFWERYRRLLAERKFSGHVLATMDSVTNRILGLMENPKKEGKWDRRGMVVGHVQSGKTANYTGLICKAADAGYEVIIVIAGIHNNLRNQTQMRVDEGFLGFDSAALLTNRPSSSSAHSRIGVGRFDATRRPSTFTNSWRDFNKTTATNVGIPLENLKQPAVFVIKKNSNTLKNLLEWLKVHNVRHGVDSISAPMLLVDDEADNASINIKKNADEVSRINGQIRELLGVFDRSCYVGYTATPFANIFIDPDTDDEMFGQDLFPRHFIISLDPPDNYFGAARVFIDEPKRIIRHIEDNGDLLPLKHPIYHQISNLPKSLCTAVRTFVLARAIRLARGQSGEHNSMLVNASRFTRIQSQLRNEIHELVNVIRSNVRVNGAKPEAEALHDPEIAALHDVFVKEYMETCGVPWSKVQTYLLDSINPVDIVEINSRSSGALTYADYQKSGLNVIAVGGYSLSRGLTLEGLIVSYFLRNSMMYDTLMQMGRWFGYRQGYDDLCRVWVPEEAEGWYAHITDSIEELRDDLRRMESVGATPEQFGLCVRSHPDTLIVTARNKMGSGEQHRISVGLANRFIETAILRRDEESLAANRHATVALAENLRRLDKAPEDGVCVSGSGGRLVLDVPVSAVMDFLSAFKNHPDSVLTDPGPVHRYIDKRSRDELSNWDVLFAGIRNPGENSLVDRSLGFDLYCQRRTEGKRRDERTLFITKKQRVASRGMEKVGLRVEQIQKAEADYREKKKKTNYPDLIYRKVRTKPLLIVHLLAIGSEHEDLSATKPVVAWSISFPETGQYEEKVEYVVNTTWFREHYEDEYEDEVAGDDE